MIATLFPVAATEQPIAQGELIAVLTLAIKDSAGGGMSRHAEGYLAGVCAEHIATRIALAGLVVVRQSQGDRVGWASIGSPDRSRLPTLPPTTQVGHRP